MSAWWHRHHRPQVIDFRLYQIVEITGGGTAITGVQVGGTGTFVIGLVPPNGVALQSGPAVSTTDGAVTLSPVSNLTFTASVALGDANTSFPVTITGVNGAGQALTHTFTVPILPPPAIQVTDFTLDQTA